MTLVSSLALGVLQGVTEVLPVSSSAHLSIAGQLLGIDSVSDIPEFFNVLVHLGVLAAVCAAYGADIWEMAVELFQGAADLLRGSTPSPVPRARRLLLLVIAGTLPLFLVLPVKVAAERLGDNLSFVAFALLVNGCLLYASDRVRPGQKDERTAGVKDALMVGIGQAVAACPGLSRSGTTITAGGFAGFQRSFAVRYSFLLSVPALLGAKLPLLRDAAEAGIVWGDVPCYLAGAAAAALSGCFCIRLLRMIARRGRFIGFAYYCWAAGALTLVLTLFRH